jgi:diguanylate cyclase (GGDEF)-like protein
MKILIADDQLSLAHALSEQVRPWGFDAQVVPDGLAALETLRADDAPRMALLDWLMPGLDGIEVCRQLRRDASCPYPYLILVTGQGGREEMSAGLEAGADDFLVKPFDAAELKARLGSGRRIVQLQEQLRETARRDALTGLCNRAVILDTLERECERSRRERRPLAILLADLDHFKQVNDTYGHLAGDAVLRQTASHFAEVLRPYDAVGRYGGEEFLVVLPGCDGPSAASLAERLRHHIAGAAVHTDEQTISITLSLGVAAWHGEGEADPVGLLRAADEALYRAKDAGRNRSVLAGPHQRVRASAAGNCGSDRSRIAAGC